MTSYTYTVVRLHDVSRGELLRLHEIVWECRLNRERALLLLFETRIGRDERPDQDVLTELARTIYSVRGEFPLKALVRTCDLDCLKLLTAVAPEARFADTSTYVGLPTSDQRYRHLGDGPDAGGWAYLEDDFWDALRTLERKGVVTGNGPTVQRLGLIPNLLGRTYDTVYALRNLPV